MKNNDLNKRKPNEEERLLTFLQKTKEGTYAKIDESSLAYIRIREETESVETINEEFCYSVS